jgi:serine/threonine protein kinase
VAAALAARRSLLVGMAAGLLSAISFCHQRGVAHCGVGAGCVMVNTWRDKDAGKLLVRLDNFGLARMYPQPLEMLPGGFTPVCLASMRAERGTRPGAAWRCATARTGHVLLSHTGTCVCPHRQSSTGEAGLQQLASFPSDASSGSGAGSSGSGSSSSSSSSGGVQQLALEDTDAAEQRQQDLQAAALLLCEVFLAGTAVAGADVTRMADAAALKRLMFDVFHEVRRAGGACAFWRRVRARRVRQRHAEPADMSSVLTLALPPPQP